MKKIIIFLFLMTVSLQTYAEGRYDFNFPIGTSLSTALFSVASRDGREILVNIEDKPMARMTLYNRTVDEVIDLMAQEYGFNWRIENNAILVTPPDSGTQVRRFVLKNASTKLVKEELLSFLPESKIRINPEYNSLSVDGTPAILRKVENLIEKLDQPVSQIFIMAQMIEVTRSDSEKLGFQYTLPNYDSSNKPFQAKFTVTSEAIRNIENGTILARPAVTTFNGTEATLMMGDKVPVIQNSTASNGSTTNSITFQDVGAQLKATPFINDKEKKIITLELEPSISSVVSWITNGSASAPQISTRTAKTKVRVRSGDNIVIGGLMRQSDVENLKGIPGLMDLPILGKLFKHRERTKEVSEVFFVVTPYLLDEDTTLQDVQNMLKTGKVPKENTNSQPNQPDPNPSDSSVKPLIKPLNPTTQDNSIQDNSDEGVKNG